LKSKTVEIVVFTHSDIEEFRNLGGLINRDWRVTNCQVSSFPLFTFRPPPSLTPLSSLSNTLSSQFYALEELNRDNMSIPYKGISAVVVDSDDDNDSDDKSVEVYHVKKTSKISHIEYSVDEVERIRLRLQVAHDSLPADSANRLMKQLLNAFLHLKLDSDLKANMIDKLDFSVYTAQLITTQLLPLFPQLSPELIEGKKKQQWKTPFVEALLAHLATPSVPLVQILTDQQFGSMDAAACQENRDERGSDPS